MNQLTRVQVYLNPDNIIVINQMAKDLRIKRSQIIRDATSSVAMRYSESIKLIKSRPKIKNPLLDLVGFATSKTGTIGLNVDEIYQSD